MDKTERVLFEIVKGNKSPSIQYVLFNQDSILRKYSQGLAEIRSKIEVGEQTTYHALSVTKTFTALAILQLAEQKKLDIEQPAKKYLPDFPYSSLITIRQLLSHSAGLPNPIPLNWIHLTSEHKGFDRNEFFNKIFIRNNQTISQPNKKFAYSNLGYILLGQIIEKVSGISYEQYIRDNLINRLGLSESEVGFEITANNKLAKGYHNRFTFFYLILGFFINKSKFMAKAEGKWKPFSNYYINGASYGGIIGTPGAFVKYIQELLRPNSILISADYKKMLFKENFTWENKATGMCLSWFKGDLGGKTYFAHAGGGGGYYCEIRIYPEQGIGSVVFFNRSGMTDERFLDKLDSIYFENPVKAMN